MPKSHTGTLPMKLNLLLAVWSGTRIKHAFRGLQQVLQGFKILNCSNIKQIHCSVPFLSFRVSYVSLVFFEAKGVQQNKTSKRDAIRQNRAHQPPGHGPVQCFTGPVGCSGSPKYIVAMLGEYRSPPHYVLPAAISSLVR